MIDAEGGNARSSRPTSPSPPLPGVVARTVEAWGRLDILVNNVGITGPRGNAVEVDLEAWDSAMRVNVTSMMLMAKYAIPEMIRAAAARSSTRLGRRPVGGHPTLFYPDIEGRHRELTRAMAAHHGSEGIRVNCIAPGTVYTPMVIRAA